VDYEALQAENRRLGELGERLVVDFERDALKSAADPMDRVGVGMLDAEGDPRGREVEGGLWPDRSRLHLDVPLQAGVRKRPNVARVEPRHRSGQGVVDTDV
jgi:hypothetical protein